MSDSEEAVDWSETSDANSSSTCMMMRRLEEELRYFRNNTPFGISIDSDTENTDNKLYDKNNICTWKTWNVEMKGLVGTIWENMILQLIMSFSNDYPSTPPSIKFVYDPFHPNVYSDGRVCLPILETEYWDSTYQSWSILTAIQCLLSDPYPDVSANHEAAKLFMTDRSKYEKFVKDKYEENCAKHKEQMEKMYRRKLGLVPLDESKSTTDININNKSPTTTTSTNYSEKKRFAIQRIKEELNQIHNDSPSGISIDEFDEMRLKLTGLLQTIETNLFQDAIFKFKILFDSEYPFNPPQLHLKFAMCSRGLVAIFHPNISPSNGQVTLGILKNGWSPCCGIKDILASAKALLHEPKIEFNWAYENSRAGVLYETDRKQYEEIVRDRVKMSLVLIETDHKNTKTGTGATTSVEDP